MESVTPLLLNVIQLLQFKSQLKILCMAFLKAIDYSLNNGILLILMRNFKTKKKVE